MYKNYSTPKLVPVDIKNSNNDICNQQQHKRFQVMAEFEDESEGFEDKVSSAILSCYNSLKKTGKPQEGREWTLLAGFVKTNG